MADYDEKEDLMDRLLALGKRKKFLSYDELNREIPENMMSADDIEYVLDRLEGENISVAETDAALLERASNMALDEEQEVIGIDGLGKKVERAFLHRRHRVLYAAERGHDDDRKLGVEVFGGSQDTESVAERQPQVRKHDAGA